MQLILILFLSNGCFRLFFHIYIKFLNVVNFFFFLGKGSDLSTAPTSLSTSVTTTATLAVTSAVSTTYSTLQSQSTVNNHTSPRPSILRKRPSDRYLHCFALFANILICV